MTETSTAPPEPKANTAAARYELLASERLPYLSRARECSRLTIPSLLPPAGTSGSTDLYKPYQSTGADGVNNLAAKLLMALFPPGTPFFRLSIDDFIIEKLAATEQTQDARGALEAVLGKIERAVVNRMEQKGARKVNFEALLHLIVAGNGLLYVEKDGSEKFFPLDRYVVSRDLSDNVVEIVTRETVAEDALSDDIREVVERSHKASDASDKPGGRYDSKQVTVYTWVTRDDRFWRVSQEVCGEVIPGSTGRWPLDKPAMIPLRWSRIAGESYGRGRCEEYLGDLYSLESLTRSIVQFAAAASKVVCLVNESGVTDKQEVARAESGEVLDGDAKDVTFLHLDKGQDFQVAHAVADEVRARLERAFLMAASIQRQAERVTAEEIRVMAGELEQGLGGVYSILSEEFQRPLVTRIMHVMSTGKNKIPRLPDGTVSPQIVTGLDGLGRNTDMQRLDALIQGVSAQFGPEVVAQYVNVGAYMARRGSALGIDLSGLIRSEEEVQQQNQQAQMREMAGKLGGPAIGAISDQMKSMREAPAAPAPTAG